MTEAPPKRRPLYKDRNLQLCFGVTLMVVMGVTSIAPAFPAIIRALDKASEANIGLIVTMFTVPGVVLTPFLGVLADRLGRKRVLVPSLLLFGLAGPACVLAPDFHAILVLRFFQGIGAAALGALNVTIIGDLYEGADRTAALGYNAGVLSLGIAAYPLLGGALAWLHWRLPFLLPLLALPMSVAVWRWLRNPEPNNDDNLGQYFRAAWRGLKRKQVLLLFFATLITFILIYGPFLTYLPVHLGQEYQASSFTIGLIMSLSALATGLAASSLGKLARVLPQRIILYGAFGLYAMACAGLALVPGLWWQIVPVILFGLGQGVNMPSIQSLLAGLAPMENRAAFMSLNGMVLRVGQTLGPLLMAVLFAWRGVEAVFYGGALLALGMGALLAVLLPSPKK